MTFLDWRLSTKRPFIGKPFGGGVQAKVSGPTAALTNSIATMKAPANEAAAWRAETNDIDMIKSPSLHPQ